MTKLHDLVAAMATSDARSALYYLSRYLKQAAYYEEYGKDIFEDDGNSNPNDTVRAATISMIEFIEHCEGGRVAQFDENTYLLWADRVFELESGLDPEASRTEVERANEFVNELKPPLPRG